MELNRAKPLSVFGLVMINVIAICSLRTLPFSAQFGSYIIPVYLLAALGFLLPITAISSFFASRFPEKGGIYIWVRQTLGLKLGFMAIWLQWLYNLLWYPTAMVFIVETLKASTNILGVSSKPSLSGFSPIQDSRVLTNASALALSGFHDIMPSKDK